MMGIITLILLLRFVVSILSLYHEPSMTVISSPKGLHPDSLFGFSLAYLKKHLFISAPKYEFGNLFDYDILNNTDLKKISSPFGKDNYTDSYWLGAVIKTGSSFIVTCAPRTLKYWHHSYNITRGTCYTVRDNTMSLIKDIHEDLIDFYSNSGADTSGWSIEIDPEDNVYIGNPAITLGESVKIYKNINDNPLVLGKTPKTFNFGHSIASGYFLSENEISYAISSTYGVNGEGMVKLLKSCLLTDRIDLLEFKHGHKDLYGCESDECKRHITCRKDIKGKVLKNDGEKKDRWNFEEKWMINNYNSALPRAPVFIFNKLNKEVLRFHGNEVGASYGAVLSKVHLTGKRSSLLVGSPTFSENDNTYDNGAVYLYVPKNGTEELTLKRIIRGQKCGGYFGFAIVSLGDMDGDQKDEVAIGAPYEDDMKGAVYIYSGSGLWSGAPGWLQRIQPEGYRSFGLSLVSLDNSCENGCNGLAVSAPLNERVFLFKCNNYITLNISAFFPNLQTRTNQTFFSFTTCIKVDLPKKQKITNSEIAVKVELMHPDVSLEQKDGTFIYSLDSRTFYCNNIKVLTPTDGNYDVLIAYKISASLNDVPSPKYSSARVLLSERSNLEIQGELWGANCESSTGECKPQLNATLLSNISFQSILQYQIIHICIDPYIVGSDQVSFSLSVFNGGETAYTACLLVLVAGAPVLRNPHTCSRHNGNEQLMCKSPIPIHNNVFWEIGEIQIDTNLLTSNDENITIKYIIYNHCNNDEEKQEYEKVFYLDYDKTRVLVTGVSNPSDVEKLTTADLSIEQQFEHFYMITNNGSTHWVDVRCEVLLEKREYLNYKVYILKEKKKSCVTMEGETNITSICDIGDLQHNQLVNVIVHIEVLPNSLGDIILTQNVTITTQFAVLLRENRKIQSITTTLILLSNSVPVWIPVIASLLALLIILIIIIILYKKHFFQRKHHKELNDLKASIHED